MSVKVKVSNLTLDEACEQYKRIFIKNSLKTRGIVTLSIVDSSGRKKTVNIPRTDAPIELTSYTSKKALAECDSLRNYLRIGMLVILEESSSVEAYKDPEIREEAVRVGLIGSVANLETDISNVPDSSETKEFTFDSEEDAAFFASAEEIVTREKEDEVLALLGDLLANYRLSKETLSKVAVEKSYNILHEHFTAHKFQKSLEKLSKID